MTNTCTRLIRLQKGMLRYQILSESFQDENYDFIGG